MRRHGRLRETVLTCDFADVSDIHCRLLPLAGALTDCSVRQRCGLGETSSCGATDGVVVGACGEPALARPVDLLVLVPGDDVQVALVVRAGVAADEAGVGELGEVLLDVGGGVFGAQDPKLSGGDRGVVAVAALVVGLGEEAEEGALGGQGDRGQGFGDEGFGLDGADACQERGGPHSVARGAGTHGHRRLGRWWRQAWESWPTGCRSAR